MLTSILNTQLGRTSRLGVRRNQKRLAVERLEDRTVPSTIQGAFFEDESGDGNVSADPNLTPSSVTMHLDQNHNGVRDASEATDALAWPRER
jgi:hypothetical protein